MLKMPAIHHIPAAIAGAMVILGLDFVVWRRLVSRFGRIRQVMRLASLLALTYVPLKSCMSRFRPAPCAKDKLVNLFFQVYRTAMVLHDKIRHRHDLDIINT